MCNYHFTTTALIKCDVTWGCCECHINVSMLCDRQSHLNTANINQDWQKNNITKRHKIKNNLTGLNYTGNYSINIVIEIFNKAHYYIKCMCIHQDCMCIHQSERICYAFVVMDYKLVRLFVINWMCLYKWKPQMSWPVSRYKSNHIFNAKIKC